MKIDDDISFMPEDFFTKIPLYKSFDKTIDESKIWIEVLVSVLYYSGSIDIFCPSCKKESTFISQPTENQKQIAGVLLDARSKSRPDGSEYRYAYNYLVTTRYFQVRFVCSRDSEYTLIYFFSFIEDKLTKIGQFPSMADLAATDIKKYAKVLGKDKYREFSKSIGLVAHGVGIGSFVYLRRIFEDLIEEAHTEAKESSSWDENNYRENRVSDKIVMLKDYVPHFLVKNRNMYGILSKGIHELSEEECLQHFPIMKNGIELILDEKIEKIESQKKIKETGKSIAQLHQSLGDNK